MPLGGAHSFGGIIALKMDINCCTENQFTFACLYFKQSSLSETSPKVDMDTDTAANAEVLPCVSLVECDQGEFSVTENPPGMYHYLLKTIC